MNEFVSSDCHCHRIFFITHTRRILNSNSRIGNPPVSGRCQVTMNWYGHSPTGSDVIIIGYGTPTQTPMQLSSYRNLIASHKQVQVHSLTTIIIITSLLSSSSLAFINHHHQLRLTPSSSVDSHMVVKMMINIIAMKTMMTRRRRSLSSNMKMKTQNKKISLTSKTHLYQLFVRYM